MTASPEHQHVATRPSWDCAACGQPWPCPTARSALLAEFHDHPSVLTIYMSTHLGQATVDLTTRGEEVPQDIYERFVGWIRGATRDAADEDPTSPPT